MCAAENTCVCATEQYSGFVSPHCDNRAPEPPTSPPTDPGTGGDPTTGGGDDDNFLQKLLELILGNSSFKDGFSVGIILLVSNAFLI